MVDAILVNLLLHARGRPQLLQASGDIFAFLVHLKVDLDVIHTNKRLFAQSAHRISRKILSLLVDCI